MLELPGVRPCPVLGEMWVLGPWVGMLSRQGEAGEAMVSGDRTAATVPPRGAETCWLLVTLQGIMLGPALGAGHRAGVLQLRAGGWRQGRGGAEGRRRCRFS